MKRRRVKITGIGPVTPAGIGREAFWKGILEPVSRVRPYLELGSEYGSFVAAYIDDFDISNYIDKSLVKKGAGRHTLFAIAGTILALDDAGLSFAELRKEKCVVVTGSSLMDFGGIGGTIQGVQKRGWRAAQPRVIYTMGVSSVASGINQSLGLNARTMAVSTQCNAGMDAIGYAADLVATGEADIAICGGSEAPLHRFPLLEFRATELTPPTTEMAESLVRPFDLWRTTGVISEGASMFVIEPEESHRSGYSIVAGYAFANDESDRLCSGLEASGRLALADARLRPEDVDMISAWGPGHKEIDAAEVRALHLLFEGLVEEIPVVSAAGAIGIALGAAPATQVAIAALGQRFGIIPPTVNWKYPDPACRLNLSNMARLISQRVTLVNCHGAGGINASMILERC